MARRSETWAWLTAAIGVALGASACAAGVAPDGEENGGTGGSGGTSGSSSGGAGGSSASGGSTSSGGSSGATGSGGSTSSGGSSGTTASGGSTSSGGSSGTTGSGGSTSSGGSSGTTGSGGSTASGGSGGSAPAGTQWTFDNDLQGWTISFAEPASIAASALASWDSGAGDPASGSAQLTVAFSAPNQKLDFSIDLGGSRNLSGKTLSARVRLDSGMSGDPSNPGGGKLYVKSGDAFVYADGGWNNMDASTGWVTLSLNVNSPAGFIQNPAQYNASDVRELGVELATGSSGSSYTTAHVHIDSVGY